MDATRRAEYHRTIGMLRRCAEGQAGAEHDEIRELMITTLELELLWRRPGEPTIGVGQRTIRVEDAERVLALLKAPPGTPIQIERYRRLPAPLPIPTEPLIIGEVPTPDSAPWPKR